MDAIAQGRPRFQFHLSTAVVMMFVAAAVLWLNLGLREHHLYGWPFHVYSYDFTYYDAELGFCPAIPTTADGQWLAVNVILGLLLVVAVGIACEERLAVPPRLPHPAVLAVELCCLAACVLWNLYFPLHWYFQENLGPPLVARVLSWLFLTFAAAFLCRWWLCLSKEWKRSLYLLLLGVISFGVFILPFLAMMRSGRQSPRRNALNALEMALQKYKEEYGSYPPDDRPRKSSGQTLYEYLCKPLSSSNGPFINVHPRSLHVLPDGTTELRGPDGHRYLYRLMPSEKPGQVEPIVEEIQPRRIPPP
jgi:hypothetical protein